MTCPSAPSGIIFRLKCPQAQRPIFAMGTLAKAEARPVIRAGLDPLAASHWIVISS